MLFISLLFIQLLIFVSLALMLRYFLTSHIRDATGHLQKLSQEYTQKIEEVKKQKDDGDKLYKDTILKANQEAELLKQRFIEEGHAAKREMLEQAHQQVEEVVNRAQTAADLILQDQDQNIQTMTLDKMRDLMSELLPGTMSEQTHSQWIEELIQNGFAQMSNLSIGEHVKEVEVTTAFALKPKEKTELQNQLSRKIGRQIHLKEEIDPRLVLGIRLNIDSLVIDGSLQHRIKEWLRRARSENTSG